MTKVCAACQNTRIVPNLAANAAFARHGSSYAIPPATRPCLACSGDVSSSLPTPAADNLSEDVLPDGEGSEP